MGFEISVHDDLLYVLELWHQCVYQVKLLTESIVSRKFRKWKWMSSFMRTWPQSSQDLTLHFTTSQQTPDTDQGFWGLGTNTNELPQYYLGVWTMVPTVLSAGQSILIFLSELESMLLFFFFNQHKLQVILELHEEIVLGWSKWRRPYSVKTVLISAVTLKKRSWSLVSSVPSLVEVICNNYNRNLEKSHWESHHRFLPL